MQAAAREQARLDQQAAATCHRLAGVLFPWDLTRSLELALLKTFCIPAIAGLLDRTGEFARRPRKRYDDTGLMVAELLRHGPDSAAGQAVINRMNRIHGSYAISNDDFLYVLSTFVAEPIRWLQRYGWRPLSPAEQEALHRFWRRVGERMQLRDIPDNLTAMLALNSAYERRHFRTGSAQQRLADATLTMLLADWPAPLRPALRRGLQALPELAVQRSLGWPAAAAPLVGLLRVGLRLRSSLSNGWRRLRSDERSHFFSERPTPSYGPSFALEQLGPPPLLDRLNRPRWRGAQRRIGLTGGIATGKSSVADLLAARGWPVLDADRFAREALMAGSAGSRAVLERYGEAVQADPAQAAGGSAVIDRAALGRIVFADAGERAWLEQLVHPLVRARFAAELERLAGEPVVVLMIPLLFEAGLEELCSEVWLVDCDEQQQQQRLMQRNDLSAAEANARIAAQWPLARKRPLADRLINNRGAADQLARQLQHLEAAA
jgi:dephospho-CoA kinase